MYFFYMYGQLLKYIFFFGFISLCLEYILVFYTCVGIFGFRNFLEDLKVLEQMICKCKIIICNFIGSKEMVVLNDLGFWFVLCIVYRDVQFQVWVVFFCYRVCILVLLVVCKFFFLQYVGRLWCVFSSYNSFYVENFMGVCIRVYTCIIIFGEQCLCLIYKGFLFLVGVLFSVYQYGYQCFSVDVIWVYMVC